jgi:anti-sigma factor ChrR (cupin superfamily)
MLINADFSQRVVNLPAQRTWLASPQGGVQRVMLDRIGAEQARATSLVSYAPGAKFPAHAHPQGEEILVLEGVFSDESRGYPQGWYIRNPPGSAHRPFSTEGALIFVKLMQMPAGERQTVRIDTTDPAAWHAEGDRQICSLFDDDGEQVHLERWPSYVSRQEYYEGGCELLVLGGCIEDRQGVYPSGSWLRLPAGYRHTLRSGSQGALFYKKSGHLKSISTMSSTAKEST